MDFTPQEVNKTDVAAFGAEDSFDFNALLQREGGDKLHTDSGGLTKYGITSAWGLDDDQITNLTEADALKMYGDKYAQWTPSWTGEGGSQAVGDKMFDVAVNMGRHGSNKVMQQALTNLGYETDIDGGWVDGGQTDENYQTAIHELGETEVLKALISAQKQHYKHIIDKDPEKYGSYGKGWDNRADFMSDYSGISY